MSQSRKHSISIIFFITLLLIFIALPVHADDDVVEPPLYLYYFETVDVNLAVDEVQSYRFATLPSEEVTLVAYGLDRLVIPQITLYDVDGEVYAVSRAETTETPHIQIISFNSPSTGVSPFSFDVKARGTFRDDITSGLIRVMLFEGEPRTGDITYLDTVNPLLPGRAFMVAGRPDVASSNPDEISYTAKVRLEVLPVDRFDEERPEVFSSQGSTHELPDIEDRFVPGIYDQWDIAEPERTYFFTVSPTPEEVTEQTAAFASSSEAYQAFNLLTFFYFDYLFIIGEGSDPVLFQGSQPCSNVALDTRAECIEEQGNFGREGLVGENEGRGTATEDDIAPIRITFEETTPTIPEAPCATETYNYSYDIQERYNRYIYYRSTTTSPWQLIDIYSSNNYTVSNDLDGADHTQYDNESSLGLVEPYYSYFSYNNWIYDRYSELVFTNYWYRYYYYRRRVDYNIVGLQGRLVDSPGEPTQDVPTGENGLPQYDQMGGSSCGEVIIGYVDDEVTDPDNTFNSTSDGYAIFGFAGDDTLVGTSGKDELNGGTGDDFIIGGPGTDLMIGGTGSDTFIGGVNDRDTISGFSSAGTETENDASQDFVIYTFDYDTTTTFGTGAFSQNETTGVNITLPDANSNENEPTNTDELIDIQGVVGSAGDDILIGSDEANTIVGGFGDDYLNGGAGDDIIYDRGDINSSFDPNTNPGGLDLTFNYYDASGNPQSFTVQATQPDGDADEDIIIGGSGNDIIFYWGGTDTISGGENSDGSDDNDILYLSNATSGVDANVVGSESDNAITVATVEQIVGSGYDDIININSGLTSLTNFNGGAGNDTIQVSLGLDTTVTGSGTDYTISNSLISTTVTNTENVTTGSGNDTFNLTFEYTINIYDGGANTAVGDTANYATSTNDLFITQTSATSFTVSDTPGGSEDTLNNFETIVSGSGNDTFSPSGAPSGMTYDGGSQTTTDTVVYDSTATPLTIDTINNSGVTEFDVSDGTSTDTLIDIETITTNTDADFNINLDTMDDNSATGVTFTFNANGTNNTFNFDGDGTLDEPVTIVINADTGSETTLDFSSFDSGVNIDLNDTGTQEIAPNFFIQLDGDGLWNVIGTALDDIITGDDATNTISGGAGDDIIAGGGGTDTLNGNVGTDTIAGGHIVDCSTTTPCDGGTDDGQDTITGGPDSDMIAGGNIVFCATGLACNGGTDDSDETIPANDDTVDNVDTDTVSVTGNALICDPGVTPSSTDTGSSLGDNLDCPAPATAMSTTTASVSSSRSIASVGTSTDQLVASDDGFDENVYMDGALVDANAEDAYGPGILCDDTTTTDCIDTTTDTALLDYALASISTIEPEDTSDTSTTQDNRTHSNNNGKNISSPTGDTTRPQKQTPSSGDVEVE